MANNEDEIYRLENVPVFEAMYGKGMISPGGHLAVDRMFEGIDLSHKHVLDIGFGIGGIAHYLASTFDVQVTGLEVHPWMVDYATRTTPEVAAGRVQFLTYDDQGNIPLPSACIDLVYSKGVLTNVEDKRSLFQEIVRVLRPHGELCLIDWLVPPESGPTTERLFSTGEMSYKETEASYREILTGCGFQQLTFENVSQEHLTYLSDLAADLSAPAHIETYGDIISSEFREHLQAWNTKLMHAIESGEQAACRIRAAL